jgi:hypothetical protein
MHAALGIPLFERRTREPPDVFLKAFARCHCFVDGRGPSTAGTSVAIPLR